MPVVSTDITSLLTAGLKTDFLAAYNTASAASVVPQLATVINTTLPTQTYGWLGAPPSMREWKDQRIPKGIGAYTLTISDKLFEASIAVDRRAIEDDQFDMIRSRVRDLALEPVRHQEQLVVEGLALGATTACYDGQYLIDTDHSEGTSGTQSNKGTSALSQTTLQTAMSAMMGFVDDTGKPLRITPDTLLVGPKLAWIANEIVRSNVVVVNVGDGAAGSGATAATNYLNPLQGILRVIVSPYLVGTYDDYWFLLDTSRSMRAVILQTRSDVPIEFSALDNPNNNEHAFLRDSLLYGVRGRYNIGYGLWQTVYGGIVA